MAEIKWIKIVTDVFDDEKILMIESMPEADSVIVIWFKLLCLAGKQNNSGVFLMGRMPYTDEMFSTIFRRPLNTVRMALKTFEQFGMIEIVNNTVTIPNWGKHQSIDQIEAKNEYMKNYMKEYRAKQKLISEGRKVNCKTNSKVNVSSLDKSRVKENKEKNKEDVDVVVEENELLSKYPDLDLSDSGEVEAVKQYEKQQKTLFCMKGSLGKGVVHLTPEQQDELLDRYGLDAFNYYIQKLANFIIEKNANVKNHFETINKWATEDAKVVGG
jgi:predicted phage replisome organizer